MGTVTGSYDYNVVCKVCDFQLKASQAKKRWDGLVPVCPTCWETRHPLDFYKTRDDTHKLPFTNNDQAPDDIFTFFESGYEPPRITLQPSPLAVIMGNVFTVLADGYLDSVRYWNGPLPADGKVPRLENTTVWFTIFSRPGGAVLWRKQVDLTRSGQWIDIPITPNLAVTNGTSYMVALSRPIGFSATAIDPADTPAAQTYLRYDSNAVEIGTFAMPTTLDPTKTYPLTVTIRPT